ncbi:hypothetical protein KM043_018370 [Ampulex compressa]|nr:hypothetical protein KM043_018370 [Ampulex compressa]
MFDQVATASEAVTQVTKNFDQSPKDLRNQSTKFKIDTSVHYENFNGFLPMFSSPLSHGTNNLDQNSERKPSNAMKPIQDPVKNRTFKIEDDLTYSAEARILLNLPQSMKNRRSFDLQESQNNFELLKVKNDTPAVANYPDFYESPTSDESDSGRRNNSGQTSRDKAKSVEDYASDYDGNFDSEQERSYDRYYSYGLAKGKKKAAQEEEKVRGDYRQQGSVNYNGHGQSAPTAPTLPRTTPEESSRDSKNQKESYDNVASPSSNVKTRHRFSRPVVVAEPNGYDFNLKFEQSPRILSPPTKDYQLTSRNLEFPSTEMSDRYSIYNREGRFRDYDQSEDSRDLSEDSTDYMEYTERPRRVQKNRRRPYSLGSSRKLPKEHRGSQDESMEFEEQSRRQRTKSHRHRGKGYAEIEEDKRRGRHEQHREEMRYDGRTTSTSQQMGSNSQQGSRLKTSNSWSQVTPNIEISHSSGIEIDPFGKPKYLVPMKVNLVPVANFDHATALGNSQGFDVSNAVMQNYAAAVNPLSSTATSFIETQHSSLDHNLPKNIQEDHSKSSTPVPDIIVGQSAFQSPMHALVLSHGNDPGKLSTNLRPHYLSTTMAPLFAVTPTLNTQSLALQAAPTTVTPRPAYMTTPSSVSNFQQMSGGHGSSGVPHLIIPQPTLQTFSGLLQTPAQSNPEFTVQVNPHGLQGQNPINHGALQVQPTVSPIPQAVTRVTLLPADVQGKVNQPSTNFLASASLAVGQANHDQLANGSIYLQNHYGQQAIKPHLDDGFYQMLKSTDLTPKTKTYLQTAHVVPAILHPLTTLSNVPQNVQQLLSGQQAGQNYLLQRPRDQSQQHRIQSAASDNTLQQLQLQLQKNQMFKDPRLPALTFQNVDNIGSYSNSNYNLVNTASNPPRLVNNAHLPNVGTTNVEIVNPNIKPSPIDTTVTNAYQNVHYPSAVLTTPIPLFSTTSFVTARPALVSTTTMEPTSFHNFVDSLTKIGVKTNQPSPNDLRAEQNQERPVFNPINFVPNLDIVKNQNALNSKLHSSEPLQQNLKLVPVIPGGNFFKPSYTAQNELLSKPKLTSDLEKYAEEMFKESLKTIYNSQKWNNDRRIPGGGNNLSEVIDLTKLKNEIQKLKASISDSKYNTDTQEAHQSETRLRTTSAEQKKPDQILAALEQVLKSQPSDPMYKYHGKNKSRHRHRPSSSERSKPSQLKDFLTPPPRTTPYYSKGSFQDKPGKKRPGSGSTRFNGRFNGHRNQKHRHSSKKPGGLEASASTLDIVSHGDGPRFRNDHHRIYEQDDYHGHFHSDYRKGNSFDNYPSFTTPGPETSLMNKIAKSNQIMNGKDIDFSHPRVHNLLGLLMKNKQLPLRESQTYFPEKEQPRQFFEEEKQWQQHQYYDDTLRNFLLQNSDSNVYSNTNQNVGGNRRIRVSNDAA